MMFFFASSLHNGLHPHPLLEDKKEFKGKTLSGPLHLNPEVSLQLEHP